jgi:kinesin family protein 5
MCVNARADPAATHVPFRDSKLTRLLQESLGGNARTSLVVAVSDAREHGEETVQSLAFGTRAMRVSTKARVNERVDAGQGGPGAAALRAALRGVGGRSEALERSLADREGALEEVQEQLKARRAAGSVGMAQSRRGCHVLPT